MQFAAIWTSPLCSLSVEKTITCIFPTQVTPKSGKKKEKAAGEDTPKSSRKRKEKAEKSSSGEKSTPKSAKAAADAPVNERSSIKTLIGNIPVKRRIKPVAVAESAATPDDDDVEIVKEVTKATEEGVAKAKEVGQEKEKAAVASIKSFFSTIPVKRKKEETPDVTNGGVPAAGKGEASEETAAAAGGPADGEQAS